AIEVDAARQLVAGIVTSIPAHVVHARAFLPVDERAYELPAHTVDADRDASSLGRRVSNHRLRIERIPRVLEELVWHRRGACRWLLFHSGGGVACWDLEIVRHDVLDEP